MNILISIGSLNTGGAEKFVVALANELAKKNSTYVFNLTPESNTNTVRHLFHPGVTVFDHSAVNKALTLIFRVLHTTGRFNDRLLTRIMKTRFSDILKRHHIELVNSHLYNSDLFVANALHNGKTPFVITDHGSYREIPDGGRPDKKQIHDAVSAASAIIYVADNNRVYFNQYGIDGIDQVTIENGFYPSDFLAGEVAMKRKSYNIAPEKIVFGMVSRGIPQKGWRELVVAYKRMSRTHKNIVLLLVGDSPYLRRLLSETVTKDDAIIHAGFSSDAYSLIAMCDVCVLPSYYPGESCPIVLIEYLMMGKPVITTNINGIAKMIVSEDNEYAGQVVTIGDNGTCDIDSLCNAMSLYATDTGTLKKHADNAVKLSKKYGIENVAAKYYDVFKGVVARVHQA